MSQQSITMPPVDLRRRRRFSIPGRVYFGYALAAIEGLVAMGLALVISLLMSEPLIAAPQAVWLALPLLGILYGTFSLRSAARALASPRGRPNLLAAAAHWVIAVALVWLCSLLITGIYTPPVRETWQWLFIGGSLLMIMRWALYGRLRAMMAAGRFQIDRTALIGTADAIRQFENQARIWQQGAQVVATHVLATEEHADTPDASDFAKFVDTCVSRRCDQVLLLGGLHGSPMATALMQACQPFALNLALAPLTEHERMLGILAIGPGNAVQVMRKPLSDSDRVLKRAFDLVGASLGLILFAPLILGTALLVKLTSPGPVLFRQQRRGFNGKHFDILRFRSITSDGSNRNTPIGLFLRRCGLDELPLLLNVLRGEMSLVGPRPYRVSNAAELSQRFAVYAQRQGIKPGITGWARVNGLRGEIVSQPQLEGRTSHDLSYAENWSFWLDVRILLLTLSASMADTAAD